MRRGVGWKEISKQGSTPTLGRGVYETKSKNGRSRPRKPFTSRVSCAQRGVETLGAASARPNPKMGAPDPENPLFLGVFCAQRGIETMVSEGAGPWGRRRSGDCQEREG